MRIRYATAVLQRWLTMAVDFDCPYCGHRARPIWHKWLLLVLMECPNCQLRFRVPKDDRRLARRYYDEGYVEDTVTDLPSGTEWSDETPARFHKFLKDRRGFLEQVVALSAPTSVIDFGCSWGYVLDWFRRAGVSRCVGFEVSRPRARIGRERLGLTIYSEEKEVLEAEGTFDLVYCAHVIEHMPDLRDTFATFRRLLRPGGSLALAAPNASDRSDRRGRGWWAECVGEAHTLAITYSFLEHVLPRHGFRIIHTANRSEPELRVVAVRSDP